MQITRITLGPGALSVGREGEPSSPIPMPRSRRRSDLHWQAVCQHAL